jgi:hypothetical protein
MNFITQVLDNLKPLEEQIRIIRQTVQRTREDSPDLPLCLNELATNLRLWYERTGNIEGLEESITISRKIIELTPQYHPYFTG